MSSIDWLNVWLLFTIYNTYVTWLYRHREDISVDIILPLKGLDSKYTVNVFSFIRGCAGKNWKYIYLKVAYHMSFI